jgi:hypothetical protein
MSDAPNNTPHNDPPDARAARKAARAAWAAAPPFPVASDLSLLSTAITAAVEASSPLGAARALAWHGVPVLPISPNGDKKPLNAHGVYSATIDVKEIDRSWNRYPDALIAVPMGRRTGVFAIDADAKPPHAHDGVRAFRALEAERGATPTRTHLTASGGLHLIYRWPADRPIGCPVKGLPEGVECKGEGGGIVFPPSQRGGKPYMVVTDVLPADPPQWLVDILSPPKPKAEQTPREDPAHDGQSEGLGSPYGLKALENACAKIASAGPGARDRAIGKAAPSIGSLAAGGEIDPAHALTNLKAAGRDAAGDDSLDDKIERALERGRENPRRAPERETEGQFTGKTKAASADGKPRLKIDKNHPERTVADLRDVLAKSGRLYDRGTPVRVVFDQSLGGSVAHSMTADSLALEAHFACQPYVLSRREDTWIERDAPLPPQMTRMYLGWRGEWGLPPLSGVATTPLLSEDGSIRAARGYDTATGLWCERVPDVGDSVPLRPTRAEAEAALALVRDMFKTFCFADAKMMSRSDGVSIVDPRETPGMDESSFLAALLGAVCRPCLDLAPGALFRAPPYSGSGAGKGKLARCICAVAHGRQPSAITAGGSPEEMEKRISAALLEGGPAVLLDNFNNVTLCSASLESALTERPAKVRQFRTLDLIALNALASVFVTGNGIVLAQDIVRRFIPTELDARMEDPERRSFSGDILAEITTHRRPGLLAALLTIWRYGRLAGDLKQGVSLGSFERWCAWVRDPLLDLGCRDPVERLSEVKQRDPFRQTTGALFVAWWKHHGPSPQTAHQLDPEILRIVDPQGRGRQYVAAQLEKLAGARLGGYLLTRQRGLGIRSTATYALEQTDDDVSTDLVHATHDAHGLPPRSNENQSREYRTTPSEPDEKENRENDFSEVGNHARHAYHAGDAWNSGKGPGDMETSSSPTGASVPFMLTQDMKRRLGACGYSDEAIAYLTPERAHEILAQEGRRPNA